MKQKERVRMIALCGVFSAMELAIIYLSSVFQMLDLTIAALTVAFTLILLVEYGRKPTFCVYAAVSVLSMLIVPNKFTPICYALLFGIYPIVKPFFDRTGKILSIVFKFFAFNAIYMIIYAVSVRFLLLDDIAGIGSPMFFVTIALGNFAFFVFDYLITVIMKLYALKLRKKLGFDKLFKK
ncbi:MAG: hypothetical protein II777_02800 [Clostridia bacterium]|nr:hypothetical protein [Clostridia bacterium]